MEFNSSNLRAKVKRLAQAQASGWWIHALRALDKEGQLVQLEFFEADDAAAVVIVDQLIGISEHDNKRQRTERPSVTGNTDMTAFLTALKGCEATSQSAGGVGAHASTFLVLPDDIVFPGCSRRKPQLYLRECYGLLFGLIQGNTNTKCRYCILGTPGIGKSWFVFYCMWRLFKEETTLAMIWETLKNPNRRYLFKGGKVLEGSRKDFLQELADPNTWYVVDAEVPILIGVAARIILVSSPKREVYKTLVDDGAMKLTMPIWSEAEMQACYEFMYKDSVAPERMSKLLARYGGVPRSGLDRPSSNPSANDAVDMQDLNQALASFKIEQMIQYLAIGVSHPESDHRLLHLQSSEPFQEQHVQFASRYVGMKIAERLRKLRQEEVRDFLGVLAGDHTWGSVYGSIFEQLAHAMLAAGGSFKCCQLDSGEAPNHQMFSYSSSGSVQVQVQQRERGDFHSVQELGQAHAQLYLVPDVSNFPAVDAVALPNTLYQMTVQPSRAVPAERVNELLGKLPLLSTQQCYFFFVVPTLAFKLAKPAELSKLRGDIRVFALEIDVAMQTPSSSP